MQSLRADKGRLQAEVEALHGLLSKSSTSKAEQITAGVAKLELASVKGASKSEVEAKPTWFLIGPAKSTWQHTLKSEQKGSWKEIVSVYRG